VDDLVLAERVRHLTVKDDAAATLLSITQLAVETTTCDLASVTLIEADGTLFSAATTDERAAGADALQYELQQGPCLTAAEHGDLYVIHDMDTDPRWPLWSPRVKAEFGINSVLSLHLFTADRALGALNLYNDERRGWSEEEVVACRVVAAHASVAMARLRHEQDLWKAVDARHLVGMAQGILMARYSINPEQSFSVLRRYSQNTNTKLATVAQLVVDRGELPDQGLHIATA
jgi:GAF domain-containing protein